MRALIVSHKTCFFFGLQPEKLTLIMKLKMCFDEISFILNMLNRFLGVKVFLLEGH